MQNSNRAEEMRNQTKLLMQIYSNWEEYLTPAPLSIAILGELVFISSKTDFSINKNPPKNGYKYINYPDSFRACLMQVCTSGYWAFNEAHKNMDQIRLHTMNVPNYMKTAVKILFQENDEVIQAHLPDQLENIRAIADECLDLAGSTEKRFTDVINIIHELLEACVNAEHFYGEELKETRKERKAVKRSEKMAKTLEEEMKEAQESFKAAMDSLPSGWETMAMELVGALTESMSTVVTGMTSVVTQPVVKMCNATETISETYKDITGNITSKDEVDKINIYSKSVEILICAEMIQQFVHDTTIDWKSLYDQKKKSANTDFVKGQFIRINSSLEGIPECKPKKHAQEICGEGIGICDELAIYAPEGECEEAKTKQLIQKIRKLTDSARAFDSKSKDVTKSPFLAPKPPMMFKEESKSEKKSASQRASENARFRIEQNRAQLKETRGSYEKSVENMEKNQKELTEILISMRNCELKETDFKTTIKMLVKGMDAMGRVKQQWEKMVSNIVKTSLSRTLTDFVSTSEKTQSLSYDSKLFSKDLLYNQASQATNIASLVHMISATYTDISEKYLMDRVSSLGKLLTMDKEKPEFEEERLQLQNSCDEAQKAILRLVLKNKEEFERKTNARLEKINKELLAVLPEAAPEEMKSIQAAVQSGFTEEEEDDYA